MSHMNHGMIFDRTHQPENTEDVQQMGQEIERLGGMLHFTIRKDEDGWSAQCNEVEGIITGGTNSNPTEFEIETNIREAIHTAFHIKTKVSPEIFRSEVTQVALSFV